MKIIKKYLTHPLLSGSFIMFAGGMVVNVLNYIYHLLMGRILGPVEYGILASVFSLLYIFGIVPLSSSVAIVKFISQSEDKREISIVYSSIRKFIFKVALGICIFIAVLSPAIAEFLKIDNFWLIFLTVPILFLNLIVLVNQATAQGMLRFMGFVLPNVVSAVIKLLLGLLLVYLGYSVFGATLAILIGAILSFFATIPYVKDINKKIKKGYFDIKPFLVFSFPVLVQALCFTAFFTLDVILVKHYLSPMEAGFYAAISLLGKIIYFAVSPIASAMFPIVSKRKARNEKYLKIFFTSLAVTVGISLVVVVLYYFFPKLAILLLYGKEYLSVYKDLVWMGLFMFFYSLSMLLVNLFLSVGETKVVYYPLIVLIIQVLGIIMFHGSIREVIYVNLFSMIILFTTLGGVLWYNRSKHD